METSQRSAARLCWRAGCAAFRFVPLEKARGVERRVALHFGWPPIAGGPASGRGTPRLAALHGGSATTVAWAGGPNSGPRYPGRTCARPGTAGSLQTGRSAGRAGPRSRPSARLRASPAGTASAQSDCSGHAPPEVSGPHLRPVPPACSIFKTPHEAPLCEQGDGIIRQVFPAGITYFSTFVARMERSAMRGSSSARHRPGFRLAPSRLRRVVWPPCAFSTRPHRAIRLSRRSGAMPATEGASCDGWPCCCWRSQHAGPRRLPLRAAGREPIANASRHAPHEARDA